MELGSTIIGLIAIALCILPLVIMRKSSKKKEKELYKGLMAMANAHNCEMVSYDFGVDFAVGVSTTNNYVFYYKKRNDIVTQQCVAIKSIQKCEVEKIRSAEAVIDKLGLLFFYKEKGEPVSRFEFFNSDERFQLNGEIQLINKWESVVKKCMSVV